MTMKRDQMLGRCLTIAGSDSGGGAGIQADLKTFFALQVYGTTVVTALTAQNTLGVQAVEGVNSDFVRTQLRSVLLDIGADSVKLGMLHSSPVVDAVADILTEAYPIRAGLQEPDGRQSAVAPHVVLDPVMVSSSGDTLLSSDAVESLKRRLLPLTTVVTPNYFEALALAGKPADFPLEKEDALREVCEAIGAQGPRWVLLKGGHGKDDVVRDVLWDSRGSRVDAVFCHPRYHTTSTHGTGCTLSAAICAYLARGCSVRDSCARATQYVSRAISTAVALVPGPEHVGPVNHAHAIKYLPLPMRSIDEPNPLESYLIGRNRVLWKSFTEEHKFVKLIANGTLPAESYVKYLIQDYHFLLRYARVFALAAYKAPNSSHFAEGASIVNSIMQETELHVKDCAKWGVMLGTILSTRQTPTTMAYACFLMDVATTYSLLHLCVAAAPCFLGYGAIGKGLVASVGKPQGTILEGNPYRAWIDTYSPDKFDMNVSRSRDQMEALAAEFSPTEELLDELNDLFRAAIEFEIAFFDQAL